METKKLDLGKIVWHDESYEDKKTGKRVNPFPGVKYLITTVSHPERQGPGEHLLHPYTGTRTGISTCEPVGRQYRDGR